MTLNDDEIGEVFGEHDPRQFTEEVVERWGTTDAYAESARRTRTYSKETWTELLGESRAIEDNLGALMRSGVAPSDPAVINALEDHRLHIDRWYYPCSISMHNSLIEMYVLDERFTAHYDAIEPGLAHFMQQAALARP